MTQPSETERETARGLLAREGARDDGTACADAAGRVYDRIHAQLAPLLGTAAVDALLTRSARLMKDEFPCFAEGPLDAAKLRACVRDQAPRVAMEATITLFATFLALVATFIGQRLTTQLLRRAWPPTDDTPPGKKSP